MISSIITPVRWYNTYQEQSRFEIDSEICEYELISDKTRLLPFQFKRPASGHFINKWFLRKACTEPTINLIDSNNSLFTNDTGYWTKTGAGFVNGKLSIIGSSSSIQRSSILTPGKYYDIEIVVSSLSNGYEVEVSTNSGVIQTIDSTGTFKIKYLALTGDSFFKIKTSSGGAFEFMIFESIQIKEYVGFNAGIGDVELPIADLSLINIGTQDAIIYFGTPFNFQLLCGNYYMMLTTTDDTIYYSEVISVKDFIPSHSPYTLIEWFNNCDLSDVIYQNINSYAYKNRMYIDGPISKPEYPFKEDGVEDGNSDYNVTFKKWEKKEILTVAKCPDFIVDSLTAMKLHDTIEVTKPLRKKQLSVLPAYEIKSMEFEVIPVMNDFANNVEIKMLLNDKVIDSTCCTNITVSACRACNYTVDEVGVLTGDLYFGELFSEDLGLYNITTVATDNITGVGTLEYIMNGDRSSIYPIGTKIYVEGVSETANIGFHEISGVVYFSGTNKTHIQWSGMTTDVGPASGTIKVVNFSEIVTDNISVCVASIPGTPYLILNGEYWTPVPAFATSVFEDSLKYHIAGYAYENSYIKVNFSFYDESDTLISEFTSSTYTAAQFYSGFDILKSFAGFPCPFFGYAILTISSFALNCDYGTSEELRFDYDLHPLLQTWYDALGGAKPSCELMFDLNKLVKGLDTDGNLDEIDLIHVMAGLETDEQRLLPLFTSSGNSFSTVNTVTLNASGVKGNGTDSYIDTNWNITSNAVNYSQNSCAIVIKSKHPSAYTGMAIGSSESTTNCKTCIGLGLAGGFNLNSNNSTLIGTGINNMLISVIRNNGTDFNGKFGTSPVVPFAYASIDPTNMGNNMTIGAFNQDSGPSDFSPATYQFVYIGGGVVDHSEINTRLNTYLTSRGVL